AALVAATPAAAAATTAAIRACAANPILCANQAAVVGVDILAGDALGGASIMAGTGFAAKTLTTVKAELNAVTALPAGFASFNVVGLPPGARGVVDTATGEVKMLTSAGM